MAIELYSKTNFQGGTHVAASGTDIADLSSTPVKNRTSSIQITNANDKVIFFKKKNYSGGAMFRRGEWQISEAGSKARGGKIGFGDTISSIRQTPFDVKVFVTVIQDESGAYPGGIATEADVEQFLLDVFAEANALWEQGLIHLDRRGTIYRRSDKYFVVKNDIFQFLFKSGWRQGQHINVFFVDAMHKALGKQVPCSGKSVFIAARNSPDPSDGLLSTDQVGNTLAHEVGHFLGLSHDSAQRDNTNVMQGPGKDVNFWNIRQDFSTKQIEDVHEKLSKHVTKKTVRDE